ncbi:MAG TPA: hypothetical protein VIZ58_07755, partial [Thermoanaerobaculia bacterium]
MISAICAVLLASSLGAEPSPLSADLDGDGSPEHVSAVAKKRAARVEIRPAAGDKVLARADVPVPRGKTD